MNSRLAFPNASYKRRTTNWKGTEKEYILYVKLFLLSVGLFYAPIT